MKRARHPRKGRSKAAGAGLSPERMTVAELIRRSPKTLEVFDKHGVTFCAGCYLTMTDELRKVAGYHAVEEFDALVSDLKKALVRSTRTKGAS